MWTTITRAVERGQLGPHTKVSTTRPNPPANSDKHVICVYTSDYRDREDVMRVLRMLRAMGIEERLYYKEDAATVAGNYRRGSASLYESRAGTAQLIARREPMCTVWPRTRPRSTATPPRRLQSSRRGVLWGYPQARVGQPS